VAVLAAGRSGIAQDEPAPPPAFQVGFAKRDVTPQAPTPMWGYGARHDMLSDGVLDPLYAKAVVIEAGDQKLALVGLDLGRGPTRSMMQVIRKEIAEKAGITHVMICGSHTHHGPVIELANEKGYGKGRFDDAVAYIEKLPGLLRDAILEADGNRKPARMGIAKKDLEFNRNRHTKRQPKPTDPMLAVIRFDDESGSPIAVLANYAAHPVMTKGSVLKFSADYPGFMMATVEKTLSTNCVFLQGAAGDLSPNPGDGRKGPEAFGTALGNEVLALAESIKTAKPAAPSIQGKVDEFTFNSRIDFKNPFIILLFSKAFFPELARNYSRSFRDGITCELNTVLLNAEVALVSGPGEFFCSHAVRLKQRAYIEHTLFLGYCNGHCLYFPTIEATSEGGYGADMRVSPVELGAGERMMNRALINIYTMMGKYAAAVPVE